MIEQLANERRIALAGMEEALVLGFHLDESEAELELVCEFWDKDAEADRAFALFRFYGVRQFERRPGASADLREVRTTFVAREVRGTWMIQAVHTKKFDKRGFVSLALGHSFGGIEFRYEDVKHEIVHLYAKAKGPSEWDYFELGTNRPVDFYNPFGRQWAKVK